MAIGRLWAGRAYGTNIGNLSVTFEGDNDALRGKLRFLDQQYGIAVYAIVGSFDGEHLNISGKPESHAEGVVLTPLRASARFNGKGELHGEWQAESGTGGAFVLFPHDQPADQGSGKISDTAVQLYTARADFGPVSMTLQQLLLLADEVQQQFTRPVIVTLRTGTEVVRTLPDLKQLRFPNTRADYAKLFVQEPETGGLNRTVIVEFGPQHNNVTAQGTDEPWALGQVEKIKRAVRPSERLLASRFKQYGVFNAVMIGVAIAYLPSLPDFLSRLLLMVGAIAASYGNAEMQTHLIPHASVFLGDRPSSVARFGASIVSALVSLLVATAATILAGVLQGWLKLPK